MSNRGNFIENEVAYENAIQRNIRANAAKGRRDRWVAANADWNEIVDFIIGYDSWENRLAWFSADLRGKLADAYHQWGALTDKQTELARSLLAKAKAFEAKQAAEREAARATAAATSNWVGTVGDRADFEVTLTGRFQYDTQFGTTYGHRFEDAAGNVLVYKGSVRLEGERGDVLKLKGTIKAHDERDGIKQTLLARVKAI